MENIALSLGITTVLALDFLVISHWVRNLMTKDRRGKIAFMKISNGLVSPLTKQKIIA